MRLSLTKPQLDSTEGTAFRDYLWWVAQDGYVTDDEIHHMKQWLSDSAWITHVPAIHYLKELVDGILSDAIVNEGERAELHKAILRILPKNYREPADDVKKKIAAERKAQEISDRVRRTNLATDRQIAYLASLGGTVIEGMTKSEASEQISRLTTSKATVRQQMVLRFWNQSHLATKSVEEVSQWMDQLYEREPLCLVAWELWKQDVGDSGTRNFADLDRVPLGCGHAYLKKAKLLNSQPKRGLGCLVVLITFMPAITGLCYLLGILG
jgi:hypothetical protein